VFPSGCSHAARFFANRLAAPAVSVSPQLESDMGKVNRHFPRLSALLNSDYEQVFAENGLAVVLGWKKTN
jgi:hypothetical protein